MDITPHTLAAITGDVVQSSADSPGLSVGEILEGLAPGNGRLIAEMLMSAVAAGVNVVSPAT